MKKSEIIQNRFLKISDSMLKSCEMCIQDEISSFHKTHSVVEVKKSDIRLIFENFHACFVTHIYSYARLILSKICRTPSILSVGRTEESGQFSYILYL